MQPIGIAILGIHVVALVVALPVAWVMLKALSRNPSAGEDGADASRRTRILAIGLPVVKMLAIAAGGLLILAMTTVLPEDVPGAMCGAGVLEAMGRSGVRTLVFGGLAIVLLWAGSILVRLDAQDPAASFRPAISRSFLLALPLLVLSAVESVRAFLALGGAGVVDCCSAVQGNLGGGAHATGYWVVPASLGAAGLLLVLSIRVLRAPAPTANDAPWWLSASAIAWAALSTAALMDHLSAYHFGLPSHRCPWCLFSTRYGAVGWPLFGALAGALLCAVAIGVSSHAARRAPSVRLAADGVVRRNAAALLAADLLFLVVAWFPVIAWRLRTGGWIQA